MPINTPLGSTYTKDSGNINMGFLIYMDAQINSLYERGFLCIGTLEDAMQSRMVTIPTLKDIAHNYGLKVSGKKNDIIQRILSEVTEEELNYHFPSRPYKLTILGQNVIEKENYMKYIHNQQDSDLDIWKFSEMMHRIDPTPYTEVLQKYYYQKATECLAQNKYASYRQNLFYQSESCIEGEMYDIALDCICRVVYCDLNGEYAITDSKSYLYIPTIEPYEKSGLTIASGILARCCLCLEKLNISGDEIHKKILPIFCSIEIPFAFFTQEECANIVSLEILHDSAGLKEIYHRAAQRFETSDLKEKITQSLDAHYRSAFGISYDEHEKRYADTLQERP